MNKEEKKVIKSMKEFAYTIYGTLSIKEAQIVLTLLEKKDKIIDLMAKELVKAHEWFYSEFDNYTKEDFIKYFENKAEEDE